MLATRNVYIVNAFSLVLINRRGENKLDYASHLREYRQLTQVEAQLLHVLVSPEERESDS